MSAAISRFAPRLLDWHDQFGRHQLPWQHPRSPYRVWLSEIMLQQTQVAVATDYFLRFVAALPDLPALARAPLDQVLALWSGLGYYARARNLHSAARLCMAKHSGVLPDRMDALLELPGIGRSTAGAILALAHDVPAPILDGNAKRLLCRVFAIEGWPGTSAVEKQLWALSEKLLPRARLATYTQALMDLGATVCTRANPACGRCPLQDSCRAHAQGRTTTLPTPRPGKPLPQREAHMLVIKDAKARVLLQQRPPAGLWASLWSLPELPDRAQALAWFQDRFDDDPAGAVHMAPFLHGFSHYRLSIHPILITISGTRHRMTDRNDLRWMRRDDLPVLGLPAPVRKLLQEPSE
ncbi:MAG: A/G-specific adenine glycosylase [Thermomonas sp.]|uniref:A/G-specific adenine glycosylase n=1 Tax=Thermomonas sp. TaxID=1971895 RepID=UPI002636C5EC|nr:A/G-specific adenine glycosylase [Thermomonas sp.]MCC7097230.1 A/G-specific adenine glycosylase [Thermomonas sp.]